MEFINYAGVSENDSDSDNSELRESVNDCDFIDDTKIENNPSDYYDLTDAKRSISYAENDAFSEKDLALFQIEDEEV